MKTMALHPGVIFTNLFQGTCLYYLFFIFYPIIWCFTKSPYRGAQTTLHLCYSNYEDLFNGNYYDNCQIGEISKLADNPDQRKRFMKYSAQLARNCYNDRIDDPELSRFINSLSN